MARRRFFVDEVRNGRAQIQGDDAHHLTRVLRVQAGQKYELSDDQNVYLAEVEAARKDVVSFVILETFPAPQLPVHLTLAAALIKFDRFEWLVEKATELGVAAIVPFMAERSERGLDRAADKRLSRWKRIAREASEQSRRARLPAISDPLTFDDALAVTADVRLALDEDPGARPVSPVLHDAQRCVSIALLVGPEGGWTDRERAGFAAQAWTPVSLGATVLRAETAAIAGIAIAMACCRNNSAPLESSL
jgi:16S rRNA (uracil1498-N3)-methyltransferase